MKISLGIIIYIEQMLKSWRRFSQFRFLLFLQELQNVVTVSSIKRDCRKLNYPNSPGQTISWPGTSRLCSTYGIVTIVQMRFLHIAGSKVCLPVEPSSYSIRDWAEGPLNRAVLCFQHTNWFVFRYVSSKVQQ